ncbi:MAG: DUF5103 domain-containing protein [Balneolaceae bacterium]|nr:MAG: DUF5103 domain-containing protein [Balneolaceae bacterium]
MIMRIFSTLASSCLLLFTFTTCSVERVSHVDMDDERYQLDNSPMVQGQVLPPDNIKSIQLYRGEGKDNLPSMELGSGDVLTLRFDELGGTSRLFRVRVRHRNADWSDSHLMTDFYLRGYREDLIEGGRPSSVQDPHYMHYEYQFPNQNMQLRLSGNYLLEVLEYETSNVLFSVPFFVHENAGRMEVTLEEIYGLDARYVVHHQPFVRFGYPSYVISPVTDLSVYFAQNRFWGRARQADELDMSESGVFRAYLSRPESFVGVYEFRPLDIRRYDAGGPEVVEVRSGTIPPQVWLFRDVVNLDVNPRRRTPVTHGIPRDDRRARYVDVRFELELPEREATDLPVYVYGPFNNWTIDEENRMEYQSSTDSYLGRAIIKEGEYDYKYALVERGRIDDLRLDASFASTAQEYAAMVYFWDPGLQADRLLQLNSGRAR